MKTIVTADSRGQRVVLTDEPDVDAAQVSGRWLEAESLVTVRQ